MLIMHSAQHYLTHLLREKLVKSKSRIVIVSSGAIRHVFDTSKSNQLLDFLHDTQKLTCVCQLSSKNVSLQVRGRTPSQSTPTASLCSSSGLTGGVASSRAHVMLSPCLQAWFRRQILRVLGA